MGFGVEFWGLFHRGGLLMLKELPYVGMTNNSILLSFIKILPKTNVLNFDSQTTHTKWYIFYCIHLFTIIWESIIKYLYDIQILYSEQIKKKDKKYRKSVLFGTAVAQFLQQHPVIWFQILVLKLKFLNLCHHFLTCLIVFDI